MLSTATTTLLDIDAVQKLIKDLDAMYLGALIVDRHPSLATLNAIMPILSCRGSKPVAYFDSANAGIDTARKTVCAFGFTRLG